MSIRSIVRNALTENGRSRLVNAVNSVSGNWLNRILYGKVSYNQDGLATVHSAEFLNDPRFANAYRKGQQTGSWAGALHWRAYIYCWAVDRAMRLDGDLVECGVNRGGYALTAICYTDFCASAKRFFLLDTYDDLPDEQISAQERARGISRGAYTDCYCAVVENFRQFSEQVRIVRGAVPGTLDQVDAERVAFLSLDMNIAEPEIAAAEYFWPKLVPGAAMLLDDYGWRKHETQKQAFDEFARRKGASILSLPTGQGLLLKE